MAYTYFKNKTYLESARKTAGYLEKEIISKADYFSSTLDANCEFTELAKGHMFDIGKVGYYPEVVQHTNWDYGKNGKGFYSDIFAPGWTVASLWQMLCPERVSNYFSSK